MEEPPWWHVRVDSSAPRGRDARASHAGPRRRARGAPRAGEPCCGRPGAPHLHQVAERRRAGWWDASADKRPKHQESLLQARRYLLGGPCGRDMRGDRRERRAARGRDGDWRKERAGLSGRPWLRVHLRARSCDQRRGRCGSPRVRASVSPLVRRWIRGAFG